MAEECFSRSARAQAVCAGLLCFFLIADGVAAAADERKVSPADVTGPLVWGTADRVMSIGSLRIGGQPDRAGMRAAREAGVAVVIDLREQGETVFDGSAVASEEGLEYHRVPVARGRSFSSDVFAQVDALVDAAGDRIVFVHCAAGPRAAAWLAAHLVERDGLGIDEAIAIAERAGLSGVGPRAATEAYLVQK
jgi:protein tyrosine phosphatase (PTP) superfamily phosphohydrolase (DUF442 family)